MGGFALGLVGSTAALTRAEVGDTRGSSPLDIRCIRGSIRESSLGGVALELAECTCADRSGACLRAFAQRPRVHLLARHLHGIVNQPREDALIVHFCRLERRGGSTVAPDLASNLPQVGDRNFQDAARTNSEARPRRRRPRAAERLKPSEIIKTILNGTLRAYPHGVGTRPEVDLDQPRKRRASFKLLSWILVGFALVALVLAVSLQPFARTHTRKLLDGLEGARADFSDAQLSILPLRYQITHLKIRERHSKTIEPVFYGDELAAELRLDRLVTGHLVGTVRASGVKVVLHQPPEGSRIRLPPVEKVVPFPAMLERAQVKDGEVLYVWVREKDQPSIWFHGIEATLENVGSRPGIAKGRMVLSARGKVQRSGTMSAFVTADPYATPLSFAGKVSVANFDPSGMNGLLASTQDIKLTPGRFDMEMSFECQSGRLRGWIDPRLRGTEITSADKDIGSALKALFGKISMSLASPTEGTWPSGRIAVRDDLTDPKLQLWPTLEKVVENGFLLGIQEALKRNYGPEEKHVERMPQQPTELKTHESFSK